MQDEIGLKNRDTLYHAMSALFCTLVLFSNIISAKMVPLPYLDLSIPAGLVTYPLTFLLSDLVTEFFGARQAKLMVYLALGMSLVSFGIIELALWLPTDGVEIQHAFQDVLGLGGIRIFSSLAAYLMAQLVDIQIYTLIKRWTGSRFLWLRNNGATCISQMIDTMAIDLLFLYWGLNMEMSQVLPIMVFSYIYKALFSVLSTPLFYFSVFIIRKSWKKAGGECVQYLSLTR